MQAVSERQVLTLALTALADSPCDGEGAAAVAAKVVAFAAPASKAEGGWACPSPIFLFATYWANIEMTLKFSI